MLQGHVRTAALGCPWALGRITVPVNSSQKAGQLRTGQPGAAVPGCPHRAATARREGMVVWKIPWEQLSVRSPGETSAIKWGVESGLVRLICPGMALELPAAEPGSLCVVL